MRSQILLAFAGVLLSASVCLAEVREAQVAYKEGSTPLIGYMYTDGSPGKKPAVLIFSDWMGVGPFAKERAKQLVGLGYSAFVADIYGNEQHAKDQKEAGELATKFKSDRPLMRARARAALETLLKYDTVDPTRVGAMGFCFGGTVSLELARSGAAVAGLVSFHGGLDTPDASLAKNIKGKVLALHGADDPLVPETDVRAFEEEMRKAAVNWELVKYGNAVHAFTNPEAGNDASKGFAYNEPVATRAYQAMQDFFSETLKPKA